MVESLAVLNWKRVANNSESTIWLHLILENITSKNMSKTLFFWVVGNMIKRWERIKVPTKSFSVLESSKFPTTKPNTVVLKQQSKQTELFKKRGIFSI